MFNKFRVYLLRKHGSSIKYIAILEFHKSGIPHLHILLDRFIAQRWISTAWSSLGGGSIVDIRYVDVHRVSHSQDKFMHDIHVAVAKHYIENLRDEVKKGMREKAEQGIYPGRAPFGYQNDSPTRSIRVHPTTAPVARQIFEFYATGNYSLLDLRQEIIEDTGVRISRGYLEKLLKNPFYIGRFIWRGVEYKGTHEALVSADLFQRVQDIFGGRHKPRHRKHNFAFAGLLRCAHDGCTVTTELQKGRYVYYRCSHGRGKCSLPYMREVDLRESVPRICSGNM